MCQERTANLYSFTVSLQRSPTNPEVSFEMTCNIPPILSLLQLYGCLLSLHFESSFALTQEVSRHECRILKGTRKWPNKMWINKSSFMKAAMRLQIIVTLFSFSFFFRSFLTSFYLFLFYKSIIIVTAADTV